MSEIFGEICAEVGLAPREDRIRDTVARAILDAWSEENASRSIFASAPGRHFIPHS
jgi:hypothetical protein